MKKTLLLFMAWACLLYPVSAAAPVIQTNSFYVNDYATILIEEHRDEILMTSTSVYNDTGMHLVVLTVKDLGGRSLVDYGQAIIQDWGIGGADGGKGVLLLVSTSDKVSRVFSGSAVVDLGPFEDALINFERDNLSRSVMDLYRPLAEILSGEDPASLPPPSLPGEGAHSESKESATSALGIVFVAVLLLAVLRSYRVSRKYRDKYLKSHVRKRRRHTRAPDREELYQEQQDPLPDRSDD